MMNDTQRLGSVNSCRTIKHRHNCWANQLGIHGLIVLLSGWPVCAAAAGAQRAPVVLTAQVSPQCTLAVDVRRDAGAACWRLRCGSGKSRRLGCDLTAMHQITSLSVAPDYRHLAVMSVGEGHPILELVDLPVLLKHRRYVARCTVNPFPGMLDVIGWRHDGLLIDSDVPLTEENPEARAAAFSATSLRFWMSASDCRIAP